MNLNQLGFTRLAPAAPDHLDRCMNLRGNINGQRTKFKERQSYEYVASPLERHFLDNAEILGLNRDEIVDTCALVYNESSPVNKDMLSYFNELDTYNQAVDAFQPITHDIRRDIEPDEVNIEQVCSSTKIHPDGLRGIFSRGISSSNYHGGMEPLLPIQRSQHICESNDIQVRHNAKYMQLLRIKSSYYLTYNFRFICTSFFLLDCLENGLHRT